jgi:hypothetical protein
MSLILLAALFLTHQPRLRRPDKPRFRRIEKDLKATMGC